MWATGDAIGLTLVHLKAKAIFARGPEHVHSYLDFAPAHRQFNPTVLKAFQLDEYISAELLT